MDRHTFPAARRHRRSFLLSGLLAALTLAALLIPAGAASARTRAAATTTTSTPSCGRTIYKASGTPWVCTFDDEFAGTRLDTSKWTAWNGVNYFGNTTMCYYDGSQNVAVRNGYLNLSVTKLAAGATCATPWGRTSPKYGGAVVHTLGHFAQTGGRFEARIKFGGGVGIHNAFWMMPQNNTYGGHAEIDVAESYGALPNVMFNATHINAVGPDDAGTVKGCWLPNWAGQFHTYTLQWTVGGALVFSIDGNTCLTTSNWTTLPGYPSSAPFNQPFDMILQTLADNGSFSPAPNATTRFPVVTQVDYVRVWK